MSFKDFRDLKLKRSRSHATYKDDSATMIARVCTPDDGLLKPEPVVISYMKDGNTKCCV
jgi:hypothetical protein